MSANVNLNKSECLVETMHLTSRTFTNICTGELTSVPVSAIEFFGTLFLISVMGVMVVGAACMIFSLIRDMFH